MGVTSGIPTGIRQELELTNAGSPRAPKKIAWFYRFLETGQGAQSVIDVGYKTKYPAKIHWDLCQEFYKLLAEASKYRQGMMEPLAWAMLQGSMEVAVKETERREPDPALVAVAEQAIAAAEASGSKEAIRIASLVLERLTAPPDAKLMAVGVKAAGEVLDRGGMPKGARLHGLENTPNEVVAQGNWTDLLDRLVDRMGLDALRQWPEVWGRKENRDYLIEKYGELKVVESLPLGTDDGKNGV